MNWIKDHDNQGKLTVALALFLAMTAAVLLPLFSGIPQSQPQAPSLIPGQSVTLLSDGRWLLIRGESLGGSLDTALIWNPRTGDTMQLSVRMQRARAWHTATVLPDGTILIFGGLGSTGQVVSVAEIFDPFSQTFSVLPSTGLTARAWHTATLLTDGHVLVAGGIGSNGQTLATAELWDALDPASAIQLAPLTTARRGHNASLTDAGTVFLRGGSDRLGNALDSGDLFDSATLRFSFVDAVTINNQPPPGSPILVASVPFNNSVNVSTDSIIALRFSKPLRVETVSN